MLYRFDGFELEPAKRALRHHKKLINLPNKAFDVLVLLVEQRERMVGKDELMDAVWPQQAVSDNTLAQILTKLRAILQDDPKDPRHIRTIRGLGFQWIQAVEVVESASTTIKPSGDPAAVASDMGLGAGSAPAAGPEPNANPGGSVFGPFWFKSVVGVAALVAVIFLIAQLKSTGDPLSTDTTSGQVPATTQEPIVGILPVAVASEAVVDADLSAGLDSLFQRMLNQTQGIRALPPRLTGSNDTGLIALKQRYGASHAVKLDVSKENDQTVVAVTLQDDQGRETKQFQSSSLTEAARQGAAWVTAQLGASTSNSLYTDFYANAEPYAKETFLRGLAALKRGDYERALERFEVVVSEAPEFLVPRYELAVTQRRLGLFDKSLAQLEVLSSMDTSPRLKAGILNARMVGHWRKAEYQQALTISQEALPLFPDIPLYIQNIVLTNISLNKKQLGDLRGAMLASQQALSNARSMSYSRTLPNILNNLSGLYISLGQIEQAEQASLEAVGLFRAADRQADLARSLSRLATIKRYQGENAAATAYLEQAVQVNEGLSNPQGMIANQLSLADLARREGLYTQAEQLLLLARDTAVQTNSTTLRLDAEQNLARIALLKGNHQQAEKLIKQFLQDATTAGVVGMRIRGTMELADTYCAQGAMEQSQEHYVKAHDLAVSRQMDAKAVEVLCAQLSCALQHDDREQAAPLVQRLVADSSKVNNPLLQNDMNLLLATYYLASDTDTADQYLNKVAEFSGSNFNYLLLLANKSEKTGDWLAATSALQQAKNIAGERWTDDLENRLLASSAKLNTPAGQG